MKVKIGNSTYDSEEEPIMLILSKQDKINIGQMTPGAKQYCVFPDDYDENDIRKWMVKY